MFALWLFKREMCYHILNECLCLTVQVWRPVHHSPQYCRLIVFFPAMARCNRCTVVPALKFQHMAIAATVHLVIWQNNKIQKQRPVDCKQFSNVRPFDVCFHVSATTLSS